MTYRVENLIRKTNTTRAEVRVTWKGEAALWTYRLGSLSDREFSDDGEPLSYAFRNQKIFCVYFPRLNTLYVNPNDAGVTYATEVYLEVIPPGSWFGCYPPHHVGRSMWAEMIGPGSRAMRPGASVTVGRDGDVVRQVRTDPEGGTMTTDFSLKWDGNVIRNDYAGDPQGPLELEYEWMRSPTGRCLLKRYEMRRHAPDRGSSVVERYSIEVESVNLERPVGSSQCSFEALMSLLPHDVYVVDYVEDKHYFPNTRVGVLDEELGKLAEVVASQGFLTGGAP